MASVQKPESEIQSSEPVAPETTADDKPAAAAAAAAAPETTADAKPAAAAAATNYSSTEAPTKHLGDDGGILLRLKEIVRDQAWCWTAHPVFCCAHCAFAPIADPVCAENSK